MLLVLCVLNIKDTNAQVFAGSCEFYNINNIGLSLLTNEIYIRPLVLPKIEIKEFLPTTKKIILPCDNQAKFAGQCVCFSKHLIDTNGGDSSKYDGNAIEWKRHINATFPNVGNIVVMQIGRWGHLSVVTSIDLKNRKIKVVERNYIALWVVSERWISLDDPTILGYVDWRKQMQNMFTIN